MSSKVPPPAKSARVPSGDPAAPPARHSKGRRAPVPPCARPTPDDALRLATRKWLAGERLDVGRLAKELGIGRATLFRWIGTRDQLYEKVICAVYARHREHLLATAEGTGLDLLENVARRNLRGLAESPALRSFIEHDAEFAIRLLTSPRYAPQQNSIALQIDLLRRVVDEANITPQLDLSVLAHIIVRIGEAFLYADTIGGDKLDIDKAAAAIRVLVAAEAPVKTD